jgi:hypothetical protein
VHVVNCRGADPTCYHTKIIADCAEIPLHALLSFADRFDFQIRQTAEGRFVVFIAYLESAGRPASRPTLGRACEREKRQGNPFENVAIG